MRSSNSCSCDDSLLSSSPTTINPHNFGKEIRRIIKTCLEVSGIEKMDNQIRATRYQYTKCIFACCWRTALVRFFACRKQYFISLQYMMKCHYTCNYGNIFRIFHVLKWSSSSEDISIFLFKCSNNLFSRLPAWDLFSSPGTPETKLYFFWPEGKSPSQWEGTFTLLLPSKTPLSTGIFKII